MLTCEQRFKKISMRNLNWRAFINTWPILLAVIVTGLFLFFNRHHKLEDYWFEGQEKMLQSIKDSANTRNDYSVLYSKLDSIQKRALHEELLQNKLEQPQTYRLGLVCLLLLLLCFWVILYYYNLKYGHIENQSRNEERHENHKFKFIFDTITDLNKSILKYNLIGGVAMLLTFSVVLVLTVFIFDLFKGTVRSINEIGPSNKIMAILLIVLRTSLLGSFLLLFVIHMIKFTRSSFDQAVRFNKRKHATLFLLQLFTSADNKNIEGLNFANIMDAFRQWNVTVDSAFTDNNFDKAAAKGVFDLYERLIEKAGSLLPQSNSK
jgi:hypothetical protein